MAPRIFTVGTGSTVLKTMTSWAPWPLKRCSSLTFLIEVNILADSRDGVAVLQVDLVLVGAEAFWILPDCFTSDPVKSGKESSTCRKAELLNYMSL